jgi:hypothetical protein
MAVLPAADITLPRDRAGGGNTHETLTLPASALTSSPPGLTPHFVTTGLDPVVHAEWPNPI